MRQFIFLFCLSIFSISSFASVKADSLIRLLLGAKDTALVNLLNDICWEYNYSNTSLALNYCNKALQLSDKIKYQIGLLNAHNRLGIAYDVSGRYDSALFHYNKCLNIARATDNVQKIAGSLNNIGLTYWHIGDFKKSLENYFKAANYFETLNDKNGLASAYNNIGLIYKEWQNLDKALEFQLKAMAIREEIGDQLGLGASLTNLGSLYDDKGDTQLALEYLYRSLQLKEVNNDIYGIGISSNSIGLILLRQQEYEKALEYFKKTISYSERVNDKHGIILAYLNIETIYTNQKQYDTALMYCFKALQLADQINSPKLLYRIYYSISNIYNEKKQYQLALDYFRKYSSTKDSVLNEQQVKQINELQTNYEIEKNNTKIALLNRQQKIQALQIEKQNLLLSRRNIQISAIIAIALLGMVLIYIFYIRYNHKQHELMAKERLHQQKMRSRAIIEAEERERKRIGTDLHDGLGHLLSVIKLNLSAVQEKADLNEDGKAVCIKNASDVVDDVFNEIRTISHNMMPRLLVSKGLADATKEYLDKIQQSNAIDIHFETHDLPQYLDPVTENVLYRVVQEAINNIVKHAGASELSLQMIGSEKDIVVMIEDNGKGFHLHHTINNGGIGIKNIYSRVEALNGNVFIDSVIGRGTIITLEVPFV